MSNDILIIDGRHLLWRCSSSFRDLSVEIGDEEIGTGGIYGFLSVLSRIYDKYGGVVLVAWEGEENFRKEMYPLYKNRREASEDMLNLIKDIKEQERRLKAILKVMGVRQYVGVGCEADDVMGRLAKTFESRDVMVYSGDSDLLQLVTEKTVVLSPGYRGRPDKIYNTREVLLRYGVRPLKIPDFKALAGDSSDSIPGIRGIGDKFATKLVAKYGSLEEVLVEAKKKEVEGFPLNESFRQLIKKKAKKLRLFKDLATIRRDYEMSLIKPEKSQKKLIKHLRTYKFVSLQGASELRILMSMGEGK